MKPNEYKRPDSYSTAILSPDSGTIQYNVGSIRPEHQAATDSSAYVQALQEALDEYLNSDEWREAAAERTPCEFRPAGSEATGQQIITLADRTVSFDPRKNWDNQVIKKGEALAGSLVFTEQTDKALLISHRVSILDHNLIAGWTEGSMLQTAEKMLRDIEYTAAGKVASILSSAKSTEAFTEVAPTGKPQAVAEDLIDLLTIHVNQTVGTSLADFAILLPASLVPTLERAAQRAGMEDLETLIGATVQPYTGTDYGIFMIPKLFTSLSYRQGRSGDVWRVLVTRNAPAQSWDLEILATVDVVANGKVKVALTKDRLQTETVPFPMVTNIKLKAS